jgi:hypothetical protein
MSFNLKNLPSTPSFLVFIPLLIAISAASCDDTPDAVLDLESKAVPGAYPIVDKYYPDEVDYFSPPDVSTSSYEYNTGLLDGELTIVFYAFCARFVIIGSDSDGDGKTIFPGGGGFYVDTNDDGYVDVTVFQTEIPTFTGRSDVADASIGCF